LIRASHFFGTTTLQQQTQLWVANDSSCWMASH